VVACHGIGEQTRTSEEDLRSYFAAQTLGEFFHLLQFVNQILAKHALPDIVDPGMN